ncbi:hypothetical protein SRB17_27940 [Streptomyces sp. RB17]|nr:hypothetical protein [Streptomyces sp. RB17]
MDAARRIAQHRPVRAAAHHDGAVLLVPGADGGDVRAGEVDMGGGGAFGVESLERIRTGSPAGGLSTSNSGRAPSAAPSR